MSQGTLVPGWGASTGEGGWCPGWGMVYWGPVLGVGLARGQLCGRGLRPRVRGVPQAPGRGSGARGSGDGIPGGTVSGSGDGDGVEGWPEDRCPRGEVRCPGSGAVIRVEGDGVREGGGGVPGGGKGYGQGPRGRWPGFGSQREGRAAFRCPEAPKPGSRMRPLLQVSVWSPQLTRGAGETRPFKAASDWLNLSAVRAGCGVRCAAGGRGLQLGGGPPASGYKTQ